MEKILSITSLLVAFGYIFYLLSGKDLNPKKFRYNELFENSKFIKHFVFFLIFFAIGIFRFYSNPMEIYYTAPLNFILLITLFNPLFRALYNRNIIIATRWDKPPKGKNGIKILDRIIGALILIISLLSPIFLSAFLKKYF
ncbi:hypothetical protein NYQ10_01005 [Flavobacterium johnsoniae]|uniref:hypothetical protein n=1 Tax=Flavobacterium johnsoniae TaxID=986 RepID=UPI0025B13C96|nr:hypothetical protein [Flavobacterium johnsoniae]WJS95043.1 hypothetical protein NYQ10_01005 [Flavobacterium johnsoniae]